MSPADKEGLKEFRWTVRWSEGLNFSQCFFYCANLLMPLPCLTTFGGLRKMSLPPVAFITISAFFPAASSGVCSPSGPPFWSTGFTFSLCLKKQPGVDCGVQLPGPDPGSAPSQQSAPMCGVSSQSSQCFENTWDRAMLHRLINLNYPKAPCSLYFHALVLAVPTVFRSPHFPRQSSCSV